MSRRATTDPGGPAVLGALGAVLAIAGLFGSAVALRWVAGQGTSAFLDAAGRLDVDSFYTGRRREHLVGMGAYWALALVYAAPALLTTVVPTGRPPKGSAARWTTYAVVGVAILWTIGTMSFAFDPSRAGGHQPLIRRYEEFSYEAADLVMAATWTMLTTALVARGTSVLAARTRRALTTSAAFVGSAVVFALVLG
jgi:hypothetical protein